MIPNNTLRSLWTIASLLSLSSTLNVVAQELRRKQKRSIYVNLKMAAKDILIVLTINEGTILASDGR